MTNSSPQRCAIYTRKSSEEGPEQNFNSLHAQREACEAFIKSQTGEGWRLIKAAYNDGGLSGGTMERPALQHLLEDIRQNTVNVVVVFKVDRLTRSLTDFAKIVEVFDRHGVSFVAVTQHFNTTTSMGRLTLNVLLSFAQFEREVTGERIRDKIAASKRKGMWMGERHLGQHGAIIERDLWERVQRSLSQRAAHPRGQSTHPVPNLLAGKLFDEAGEPLYVSGTTKGRQQYRYYVSRNLIRNPAAETGRGWRLSASEIEKAVILATSKILDDHSAMGVVLHEAGFSANDLVRALESINQNQSMLLLGKDYPATVYQSISRVDLRADGLQITLDLGPLLSSEFNAHVGERLIIGRFVSTKLKRRGVELRIVMGGQHATSRTDPALIKAVARGYCWFNDLASNRTKDTREIAQREGVRDSYVRRLIPCAFLNPSIVEAICEGSQPADLTAEQLTRRKLPHLWIEQRSALGWTPDHVIEPCNR